MNRADEMVNPFIENMATVPMAEGDYLSEDGIIYCGVCHTPKQKHSDTPPYAGMLLPAICDCEQARREQAKAEAAERKHLETGTASPIPSCGPGPLKAFPEAVHKQNEPGSMCSTGKRTWRRTSASCSGAA